jgi:hypothetical protein
MPGTEAGDARDLRKRKLCAEIGLDIFAHLPHLPKGQAPTIHLMPIEPLPKATENSHRESHIQTVRDQSIAWTFVKLGEREHDVRDHRITRVSFWLEV